MIGTGAQFSVGSYIPETGAIAATISGATHPSQLDMKPPCDFPAAKIRLGSTHKSALTLATTSRTNAVLASRADCKNRHPKPPSGVTRMKPCRLLIGTNALMEFCCSGLLPNPWKFSTTGAGLPVS
jgi:hypothetical protein